MKLVLKVFALCTDNAANVHLAWHLPHDNFPSLVCFVCAAHAFSLYAKDIVKIPEIKAVVSNANAVLKWLKFKHVPHVILDEKCIEIFEMLKWLKLAVILSVEMHWRSVSYLMARLLQLRMPIKQTVMDL